MDIFVFGSGNTTDVADILGVASAFVLGGVVPFSAYSFI